MTPSNESFSFTFPGKKASTEKQTMETKQLFENTMERRSRCYGKRRFVDRNAVTVECEAIVVLSELALILLAHAFAKDRY
jgi:hypothetical protein